MSFIVALILIGTRFFSGAFARFIIMSLSPPFSHKALLDLCIFYSVIALRLLQTASKETVNGEVFFVGRGWEGGMVALTDEASMVD
jgi:hypothetical protein